MWEDIKKAGELMKLCREQKSDMNSINTEVETYYHNLVNGNMFAVADPSKVLSMLPRSLPFTNLIPFGMRVWTSVFMGAPFAVDVTPAGARMTIAGGPPEPDPMTGAMNPGLIDVKKLAADGMNHVISVTRQTPEHRSFIRRVGVQAMLYNQVAIYDGLKPDKTPFYQIISWRDLYIDPPASEPLNEYHGPACVGVRLWLRKDEVSRIYPKRYKDMKQGIPVDVEAADNERKAFQDLYPVIHWWGVDTSIDRITRAQVREAVAEQFPNIITGKVVELLEGEPHNVVVEEGDRAFVEYADNMLRDVSNVELDPDTEEMPAELTRASTALAEVGQSLPATNYSAWRNMHLQMAAKDEGGTVQRYKDGIYFVEFQEDADEPLAGPDESPYKHGQIPISTACRHEGTLNYWTPGISAEALDKQKYIQYLEKHRDVHLHFQARGFFYALRDVLPPRYRDPDTGETQLMEDLVKGLKLILIDGVTGIDPSRVMGWVQPAPISADLQVLLREKKSELMELFGAAEVMRGMGPGAEASGKHIQLKMEAASRPSSFMMHLLENPIHRHFERFVSNVLNFAPEAWLSKMCEPEQVSAIMLLRENDMLDMMTKVNLGTGMPTEWTDRFSIYSQLVGMGYMPAAAMVHELGIPVPPASEMAKMMPQVPPGMPGAPGMPGGGGGGMPQMSKQTMPVQRAGINRGT